MAKLTEEARKAIEGIRPSLVATASETGKSNVSAKGSLRILDDEHVVFADITCPRTFTNIKENPQVAVICPYAAPAAFPNVFGFPRMVAFCILWPTGGLRKMASQLSKLGVSVLRDETGRTLLSALRNSSAGLPESQEAAAT